MKTTKTIKPQVPLPKIKVQKLPDIKPEIEDPNFKLSDFAGVLKNDKRLKKALKDGHFN